MLDSLSRKNATTDTALILYAEISPAQKRAAQRGVQAGQLSRIAPGIVSSLRRRAFSAQARLCLRPRLLTSRCRSKTWLGASGPDVCPVFRLPTGCSVWLLPTAAGRGAEATTSLWTPLRYQNLLQSVGTAAQRGKNADAATHGYPPNRCLAPEPPAVAESVNQRRAPQGNVEIPPRFRR